MTTRDSMITEYNDLRDLLLGKRLGFGISRDVFVCNLNESLVVKCATEDPSANVLEEQVWQIVKDTPIAKWFAPCVAISKCGMFLVQKRIDTKPSRDYPDKVPSFFTDLKYTNFGWIDGQFVCCDYGSYVTTSMSHKWSAKLKKAEWWPERIITPK